MQIEVNLAIVISIISISIAAYNTFSGQKHLHKVDMQHDTTEMATVLVELKHIGTVISEVKSEVGALRNDYQGLRDKVIANEQYIQSNQRRFDSMEEMVRKAVKAD